MRNEVFRALADIPFHLESTRESVGIFNKSEGLRKCGVKLYTVTLEALRHILKWFKQRAIGLYLPYFSKLDLVDRNNRQRLCGLFEARFISEGALGKDCGDRESLYSL